jgi:hypothetical protein
MAKNGLRNKISGFLLNREIQRKRRTQGKSQTFEKAKSIGILYDATDDHDYELMKAYTRNLMSYSKEVVALGYYNAMELPNTRFMKLGLDFFTKKSLNWRMRPSNPIVNNFTNRSFDILILFNTSKCIPLLYIAHEVKAGFKIGRYDKSSTGLLDFMVKDTGAVNLKDLITNVNHYLMLIKNG